MEKKELKKMVKAIYNAVHETGISSHIYRDDDWAKVFELRDIAERVAKQYDPDIRIIFDNVAEWQTCKRYYVSIEDEYEGTKYGGGCIVASFAGSVDNPRDRYDVCATWWVD